MPPADPGAIRALIEAELGAPASEVFAEFDWEPLAAASIGQAHRARLHDGQKVIVKVLRPGIGDAVERDLLVLDELARTVEARTTWAAEYRVTELTAEFAARLREELDLRREASNATAIAANLADLPQVHIPEVHPELSTSKLLVMEWLDGVSVGDPAALDELGLDRRALADLLLRCFLKQMLLDGEFHADPHPGNVMVLRDGRIGLIDFGAASRLDPLEQASVRTMLVAVNRRDSAMLRDAVGQVAALRRHVDDDQFERALARFMARHLARGAVPSAAMLNDLLQLLFAFGVTLPPEFSTFFRALVTLEGTIITLSPGYPVIQSAQEVAAEWAGEHLTAASLQELARDEVLRLAPLLRRAPRHLDRVASLVERGDLRARISLFGDEADVQVITKLVNRVVMAALGGWWASSR